MNSNDISVFSEVSIIVSQEQWHQVGTLEFLDWVIFNSLYLLSRESGVWLAQLHLPLVEANTNFLHIVIIVQSGIKDLKKTKSVK